MLSHVFVSFLISTLALSVPIEVGLGGIPLQPRHEPLSSPKPVAEVSVRMERDTVPPLSKRQQATITEFEDQVFYNAEVRIGDEPFKLLVDTGSSYTWVTSPNNTCRDTFTGKACKFDRHLQVPSDEKWIAPLVSKYLDGSNATGGLIKRRVSLAGLTIPSQTIGLADKVYSLLGGSTDGILGLGGQGGYKYPPVFASLMSLGVLKKPMFSIALLGDAGMTHRDEGILAFGGAPPAVALATNKWGEARMVSAQPYQILVDDFTFEGAKGVGKTLPDDKWRQVLVDSGTYYTRLPAPIAEAVFKLMPGEGTPKTKCSSAGGKNQKCTDAGGYWKVPCSGKAPPFAVVVGGVSLPFKAENLIVKQRDDYCVSGIVSQEADRTGILGVTFMKGVVVVHDYTSKDKPVMLIAARK